MITRKTIALTIQTFVGKVMSMLFNMPSRFVIAVLPRSKHLLISWLNAQCKQVLLEKTFENPLDSNEIKLVNAKVNQS